jgi:protein-L-isoaspartate(D-aspartate) O-methyltransferase
MTREPKMETVIPDRACRTGGRAIAPGGPAPTGGLASGAALSLALFLVTAASFGAEPFDAERAAMVRTIQGYGGEVAQAVGPKGFDPRVIEAMGTVPRHQFVPERLKARAYENRPLPIGLGQTISQPLIVALMTHLLAPRSDHVVLEVGTGSGYQAAVLAHLVRRVHTIEILPALAEEAAVRLGRLGYDNVVVRAGDGYHGWEEVAPFDGIIVTATTDHVPPRLVRQLKPGGRMVIPLGDPAEVQHLTVVEVDAAGTVRTRRVLPVRFVPLTGRH